MVINTMTIGSPRESELKDLLAHLVKLGLKICGFISVISAAIVFFWWPELLAGVLGLTIGFILAVVNLWILGQAFIPLFAGNAGVLRALLGVLTSLGFLALGVILSRQFGDICLIGLGCGISSPALFGLAVRN